MRYDLNLIHELCSEIGLPSVIRSSEELALELAIGVVLLFQNSEQEQDCLVGFEGTPWHTHDDFIFADRHGFRVEMDYLDVVSGIKKGQIMVCEQWEKGELTDRWLVHKDYVDVFAYMEAGDEIRIRKLPI